MKVKSHIPSALYKKILKVLPILTVDIVIIHKGKFLLLRRSIAPAKGQWWTPGGRVLKGEDMEEAARRKVKEEAGLSVRIVKLLGVGSTYWKKSYLGVSSHTTSVIYLSRPVIGSGTTVKMNFNNDKAGWFKHIPKGVHPFVREALKKAGF